MATGNLSFEKILEEKPTLDELCEHIRIGSKWYQLGIQLKLNAKKLDDIHKLPDDSTYKTTKMFELWLDTKPDATRRQVIDTLRKEVIEEITVAHEYEQMLKKSSSLPTRMDSQSLANKATAILQCHNDTLSQCLINPVKVSQLLFSDRCIDEETLDKIETLKGTLDEKKTILLSAMHTTISSDYKKLKVLATVLSKFEETKMLSERIITEYVQKYPDDEITTVQEIAIISHCSREDHASDILRCHYGTLSQSLQYPISIGQQLYGEGVIAWTELPIAKNKQYSHSEEKVLLLRAVRHAVHTNYYNLEVFASVLLEVPGNVSCANAILNDCRKAFSNYDIQVPHNTGVCGITNQTLDNPLITTSTMSVHNSSTSVHYGNIRVPIPKKLNFVFGSIRMNFAIAFSEIREAINRNPPPLDVLKTYLKDGYSHLKSQIANSKSIDDILDVVNDHCTLFDMSCLEGIVKRFHIKEAETHIQIYKDAAQLFCQKTKASLCLDEIFKVTRTPSLLRSETAIFVLDWDPTSCTLQDIQDIIAESIEDEGVQIRVIREGQSIIVTCFFPLSLTIFFTARAQETLELIKEKGLLQLIVGHCTIYDYNRDKAIVEEKTKELRSTLELEKTISKNKSAEISLITRQNKDTIQMKEKEIEDLTSRLRDSNKLIKALLKQRLEGTLPLEVIGNYPLPAEETLKVKDDRDNQTLIVESEILAPTGSECVASTDFIHTFIKSHEVQSAQTSERTVTADWLKTAITDSHITAKAAPIILCITGLPNSKQSIATQSLLKQLQCGKFPESEKHGVSLYEASAVRKPATTSLIYSSKFNYALVMESAIKHHLYLQGMFIQNIEVPSIPTSIFDNDDDLDSHFRQMIQDFYLNRASPGNRPGWNQGLPSGIAMINIWDVGTSKTALYILPMLAGHLYSSRVWMFFDLVRDLPSLYDPPEILSERSDKASILKWRAQLYHLFRLAQLGSSKNYDRSNVCKLVACHDGSVGNGEIEHMKEQFIKEARVAAIQMNVDSLVDIEDVIPFVLDDQEGLLKKTFDHIVNMELDKPVSLPLSYIFLRSLFYRTKELYVKKDVLQSKASKLKISGDGFEHFCQFFTSLGSIIDISLINKESDIVILQPVPYFHELDKLFYPPSEVDPLVTNYGLVTESRATDLFDEAENVFVIMSSLVHFGIALELKPSRISGSLSPLSDYDHVYYVPNASTTSAITEHEPNALCLLRDVNRPMIHSKVAFTKLFLKMYKKAMLYIPEYPHVNMTTIRAHCDSTDDGVIFELVYLGDAIEFRFPSQQLYEDVVEQVITVCHKMMEMTTFKYNFAVICSSKVDQDAVYKLHQHYHHLPNNELCQICKDNGRINNTLSIYNAVLSKVKNQVPKDKILIY